jgi:hypothetical protein
MSKLTIEDLLDLWLVPYHNITIDQVKAENPKWMENPQGHMRDFYEKYPVSQEQHDEWYERAIDLISKKKRISKKRVKIMFTFDYLNCAPYVKKS